MMRQVVLSAVTSTAIPPDIFAAGEKNPLGNSSFEGPKNDLPVRRTDFPRRRGDGPCR